MPHTMLAAGDKIAVLALSAATSAATLAVPEADIGWAGGLPHVKLYVIALAFLGAATSLSFVDGLTVKKAWGLFTSGVGLSVILTPLLSLYLKVKFPEVEAYRAELEAALAYGFGAAGFYLFPFAMSAARDPFGFIDRWRGRGAPPPPPSDGGVK